MNYQYRYIARIVIEAKTPLCVGTGKTVITSDAAVARDVNGLPYIPGTSIAGVLRHSLLETTKEADFVNEIFGYQKGEEGHGSTVICSSAHMIGGDGTVQDGVKNIDWSDAFYAAFRDLPIRQHVRINEKGHAANGGKFDEEVVYKGTRFCFEVELLAPDGESVKRFEKSLLPLLSSAGFRLGGGTRKGFGEVGIVSICQKYYNLSLEDDLKAYLGKSSSLADDFKGDGTEAPTSANKEWRKYELTLTPHDFVLFGSGFGDDEADMTPVREQVVVYGDEGTPSIETQEIVVPASSVKGAIAHRTAFYYNKIAGIYADTPNKPKSNKAVDTLFGSEEQKTRGHVLFSDVYLPDTADKRFNHVTIDRFTGGAMEGALFNEKATYLKDTSLTLNIYVDEQVLTNDAVRESFEAALEDLCTGYLPLGGCTNHGHGLFTGTKTVC